MEVMGCRTGDIVSVAYKTEFMRNQETETGRLHVEPSGECWLEGWADESIEPGDIISMTKIL